MQKHIHQNLTPSEIAKYQGYSLQVFTAGRLKLSFHITHKDREEYYADCPKRYKQAYANQRNRSGQAAPEHFKITEGKLNQAPLCLLYRVHLKGDNNATADNAHVLLDTEAEICHVVLDSLHHQWFLPSQLVKILMQAKGPRKGAPSCFNEYLRSYEHDWMDASFREADYAQGYRKVAQTYKNAAQHFTCGQDDSWAY